MQRFSNFNPNKPVKAYNNRTGKELPPMPGTYVNAKRLHSTVCHAHNVGEHHEQPENEIEHCICPYEVLSVFRIDMIYPCGPDVLQSYLRGIRN